MVVLRRATAGVFLAHSSLRGFRGEALSPPLAFNLGRLSVKVLHNIVTSSVREGSCACVTLFWWWWTPGWVCSCLEVAVFSTEGSDIFLWRGRGGDGGSTRGLSMKLKLWTDTDVQPFRKAGGDRKMICSRSEEKGGVPCCS